MKGIKFSVITLGMAIAIPALGADIPRKAPPMKPMPAQVVSHNWSGCYIGGHAGYGWSDWRDRHLPDAITPIDIKGTGAYEGDQIVFGYSGRYKTDGFVGGGQFGCDQQYGTWVVGLVADISWTSQKETSPGFDIVPKYTPTLSNDEFGSVSLKYFGTARARVGYAQGPWLLYGTGGLAWARAEASVRGEAFFPRRRIEVLEVVCCNGSSTTPFAVSDAAYHLGWAAGVGFEWMFHPNWTFGIEYLHLELGEANYRYVTDFPNTTTAVALGSGTAFKLDSDIIRAIINFRFGRS